MHAVKLSILVALAMTVPGCLEDVLGPGDAPGPHDFVSSKDYTEWVVEIDVVQGMAPPNSALTLLKSRLESIANKPDGIVLRVDDSLPANGGTWSVRDLQSYSEQHLDANTDGKTVVLHLLFLDGAAADNAEALGVTLTSSRNGKVVSSGPVAIFSERIRDSCTPLSLNPCTNPDPIFGPVLVHEFGHAMGLVDLGAPMQRDHQDPAHPGHSSNRASVMYWAVETSDVLTAFTGGIPNDFDADDRADLCAIGGKC